MLNLWSLTAMTFLSVSGGPIGMETAMIGSDIYTIVLCLTWLLITYIIPISFMSYELSMEYKDKAIGGPIGWVYEGLGKRWGIANTVWILLDTHIDNSIYPVLFADNMISMGFDSKYKHTISWILITVVFLLNWINLEGKTSILLSLIIIAPFIALMVVTPIKDMWIYSSTPTWSSLRYTLTILMWNVNGFDMTTTYVHNVENPEENYK